VIYLHLLVLLLIITKCSNRSSPMEYTQKVLDVVHGVFIWQWQWELQWGLGNQQRRGRWMNGDGDDRLMAMEPGHRGNDKGAITIVMPQGSIVCG
jgi:hypothetical protein